MYRITNSSNRSFIVRAEDVIKGASAGHKKEEKIIEPGKGIVEVSDKLGKNLVGYAGITVVEIVEEKKTKGK